MDYIDGYFSMFLLRILGHEGVPVSVMASGRLRLTRANIDCGPGRIA